MVNDRRLLWVVTILFSIATFVSVTALALRDPGPPLPVLARVPSFTLEDQRGETVTRETLAGRPFIVDFFFTSCPHSCPKQAARMAALQKELRERNLPARLVSISVDKATDTPERLAQYAARFGAEPDRWTFLTGGDTELERAFVGAYELSCQKPSERGAADVTQIMHGDWFVLVDGDGRIRGFYDSRERRQLRQLLIDAERVVHDPSIATIKGGVPIAAGAT